MGLWEDIQPYLDKETGLLCAPDGGRDNLILFTAYLVRELVLSSLTDTTYDVSLIIKLMHNADNFLLTNEVSLGLYRRNKNQDNSVDNLIGALYFLETGYDYLGILRRWDCYQACFDCDNRDYSFIDLLFKNRIKYWFGRFIGLKTYIMAVCNSPPGVLNRILWSVSTIISTFVSRGSSDPLLTSLQVDRMQKFNMCKLACKIWKRKYKVSNLYEVYFGESHPLTVYRKKYELLNTGD